MLKKWHIDSWGKQMLQNWVQKYEKVAQDIHEIRNYDFSLANKLFRFFFTLKIAYVLYENAVCTVVNAPS